MVLGGFLGFYYVFVDAAHPFAMHSGGYIDAESPGKSSTSWAGVADEIVMLNFHKPD